MTDILIGQHSRNSWQRPGTTATLRIWFSGEFRDTNGVMVDPGNGTSSFFKIVPCTVNPSTHIVTIPAFTLPSTLDAIPAVIQSYGRLYDEAGTPRDFLWSQWSLSNLPTSLPFDSWFIFNQGSSLSNPPDFYLNRQEVIALIDSLLGLAGQGIVPEIPTGVINGVNGTFTLSQTPVAGSVDLYLNGVLQQEGSLGAGSNSYTISGSTITHNGPPLPGDWLFASYRTASVLIVPPSLASYTNIGVSSLSLPPVSSLLPVAVGNNDPRVVDVSSYASFIVALSAIGATPTTFNIHTAITGVTTATVPSTVTLRFLQGGSLSVTTGQTLTINGPIIADAVKIFDNALAAQGTVSILSRAVQEVCPEWWGASPAASAATNTPALQAAIIGAYGSARTNPSGLYIYNRILKFSGIYQINDELKCYHLIGFRWEGHTKLNSGIMQTAANKRIIDGQSVAYGVFSNLFFGCNASQSGANMALIDLDYSGAQGSDLRPQNITFDNCTIHGNIGQGYIGILIAKSGGGAQGDNIRILNTYISGFAQAGAQLGGGDNDITTAGATNAINVQFKGGDIQGCTRNGLMSYNGNWLVEDVTMENGLAIQTGYDVHCISPVRAAVVRNLVSESLRQTKGCSDIENVQVQHAVNQWIAAQPTGLPVDALLTGTPYGGDGKYYKITAAGPAFDFGGLSTTSATSGSATTIVNSGAAWTVNEFVGYRATIMSGPGKYQYGIITANTATTITVAAGWVTDFLNISIADPTSASTFVVEPNWGTQFSSGDHTWVHLEFDSIVGARVNIRNTTIGGGRVSANLSWSYIQGLTTTRQDWTTGAASTHFDGTYPNAQISKIAVVRTGGQPHEGSEPTLPWAFNRNGMTGFTDVTQNQQGRSWNVWSRGQFGGGSAFPELGIGPGDNGSQVAAEQNILAFLGKLGRKTPFGTNQNGAATQIEGGRSTGSGTPGAIEFYAGAAGASSALQNVGTLVASIDSLGLHLPTFTFANVGTPPNGTVIFVSDGTAGAPLTGGGTGCMAVRQNGAWKGL